MSTLVAKQSLSLKNGKGVFNCGNHLYYKTSKKIFLVCHLKKKKSAKEAHTNKKENRYIEKMPHNHPAVNRTAIIERTLRHELKYQAANSTDGVRDTIDVTCSKYPTDVASSVSFSSVRRNMARHKTLRHPGNAKTHEEFAKKTFGRYIRLKHEFPRIGDFKC